MKISAIILAAGDSTRFGTNKMLARVDGEPVILKTCKQFAMSQYIDEIIVCAKPECVKIYAELLSSLDKSTIVIEGGESRHQSSVRGLSKAKNEYALIHDGARYNVSLTLIERVANAIEDECGVIPVVDTSNSLIEVRDELKYIERSNIKQVQTPQGFNRIKLLDLYNNLDDASLKATDNGEIWSMKYPVKTVNGEVDNIKITFPSDILNPNNLFIGNGYDLHRLVDNRRLVLGGVEIPHNKGLLGHSDADVVIHALMDALLSSAGLPDIGVQFPPTDPKYKDIDSTILLKRVLQLLYRKQIKPKHVSITILAQKPKLNEFIPQIKNSVSALCGLNINDVGISATTTEGVGLVGREEAIAAYVCVLTAKF